MAEPLSAFPAANATPSDPEPVVTISSLVIGCRAHGEDDLYHFEPAGEPELVSQGTRFPWKCSGCGREVDVVVPAAASELERVIEAHNAKGETEYHPDDGYGLSQIGIYEQWDSLQWIPLGDKVILPTDPPKTKYFYGVRGQSPEIYVVVDHAAGQAAASA